jgi:hypothetical protein
MANRRTVKSGKTAVGRRSSRYVCSQCGFRAAHPAGLGRHRSAVHGVVSKRQRAKAGKATATRRAIGDAQLNKRLSELERRYDRLLTGLERVLRQARHKS